MNIQAIRNLASAINLAKANSAEAEKAAAEARELWNKLPDAPADPLWVYLSEAGWGYAVTPEALFLADWLKWKPEHLWTCEYGSERCSECEEAEKKIRYLTVEEFLGGLIGYYRKIAQEKAEQVTARNNLARGLRSALANR